jgi:ketosteroid isomerase-like protein
VILGSGQRDEAEIRQLISTYAMALDRRDLAGLARCFTDDGEFIVSREARLDGSGTPGDICYGPGWAAIAPLVETTASSFQIGTHFVGQTSIDISGEQATAETYGLSFAIAHPGTTLTFRGVRYLDNLEQRAGAWLIRRRKLTLDWSAEAAVTFAQEFPSRVSQGVQC